MKPDRSTSLHFLLAVAFLAALVFFGQASEKAGRPNPIQVRTRQLLPEGVVEIRYRQQLSPTPGESLEAKADRLVATVLMLHGEVVLLRSSVRESKKKGE